MILPYSCLQNDSDDTVLVMHENICQKINGCQSIEIPATEQCISF